MEITIRESGWMIKKMVKENTNTLMEITTGVVGKTTKKMEQGNILIVTVMCMKETLSMVRKMEEEFSIGIQESSMRGNFRTMQ